MKSGFIPQIVLFQSYFGHSSLYIYLNFSISLPIPTKKAFWDFDWDCIKSRSNWGESASQWYWVFRLINMIYLFFFLGLFQFVSGICGFQCSHLLSDIKHFTFFDVTISGILKFPFLIVHGSIYKCNGFWYFDILLQKKI